MTERDDNVTTRDLAGAEAERPPDADASISRDPAAEGDGEGGDDGRREPLVEADEGRQFTTRWQEIQVEFVDSPRESVERADALVAELMQRLAQGFAAERERLERQWDGGEDVSTEDLRVSLQRYRSFFDRLLSA